MNWENGALKGLGGVRKQMCWIGAYVSRAALTPHSWCVTVLSRPYQIREEPMEHVSFVFCNEYSLSWLHTWPSSLGVPDWPLCHLWEIIEWWPECQWHQWRRTVLGCWDVSSICWLWHWRTQTKVMQLRVKKPKRFHWFFTAKRIKRSETNDIWNETWYIFLSNVIASKSGWLDTFFLLLWDGNLDLISSHLTYDVLYNFPSLFLLSYPESKMCSVIC